MKKSLILLLSVMTLAAFAQYQRVTSVDLMAFIAVLVVFAVIFIICRELFCWYYKINKGIKNQERIIELLEKINKNLSKNE